MKQKEIFEKFDDCWDELTDINEREVFVYAFKLGIGSNPQTAKISHTSPLRISIKCLMLLTVDRDN